MEVDKDYYYDKKPNNKKNCSCFNIIIYILTILFIFVIGLIIEFVFGLVAIITLPIAIIVAVIFGIMLLLAIILSICCSYKKFIGC